MHLVQIESARFCPFKPCNFVGFIENNELVVSLLENIQCHQHTTRTRGRKRGSPMGTQVDPHMHKMKPHNLQKDNHDTRG